MSLFRLCVLLLLCLVSTASSAAPRRVWLAWTSEGGAPPVWYLVERQTETEPWHVLRVVEAPIQAFIDERPQRGSNRYRVQAATETAVSPYSNVVTLRCGGCK